MSVPSHILRITNKGHNMKTIITVSAIAVVLTIAFIISFNWANGIDYFPIDQSMMPIAITWMIGVFAFASLGGIVGAISEYRDAN
jgi:riboflavin transporter FmnP